MNKIDASRLSVGIGDIVTAGSSFLLLIVSFIPIWYKLEVPNYYDVFTGGGATTVERASLWGAAPGSAFFILLAVAVSLTLIILRLLDVFSTDDIGVPEDFVHLGTAGLAVLVVLFRLAITPSYGISGIFGIDVPGWGRSFGLFLGLILALGFAAGAFLNFWERRMA